MFKMLLMVMFLVGCDNLVGISAAGVAIANKKCQTMGGVRYYYDRKAVCNDGTVIFFQYPVDGVEK